MNEPIKANKVPLKPFTFSKHKKLPPQQRKNQIVPRAGEFCVYRHYDQSGTLLYVGSTENAPALMYGYKRNGWAQMIAFTRFETFTNRHDMIANEVHAINNEGPLFNNEGPLFNNEGPLFNNEGPLFNNEGPLFNNEGPLFNKQHN